MTEYFDDDPRVSAWLDRELDLGERSDLDVVVSDQRWSQAVGEIDQVRSLVRSMAMVEPPAGFLESLLDSAAIVMGATLTDIGTAPSRRTHRVTTALAGVAVAAAVLIAVIVPGVGTAQPALAANVQAHQAGAAASGDPISSLAPLGTSMSLSP